MRFVELVMGFATGFLSSFLYFKLYYIAESKKSYGTFPRNEAIMFPDDSRSFPQESPSLRIETLQDLMRQNKPLMRVVHHLRSAQVSLDICMYVFTSRELASLCSELISRGVRIRVIMDDGCVSMTGSQVGFLRFSGAFVRSRSMTHLMHHKFAVIDDKKLLNGSFNWTNSAVMGNRENVIVTNESEVVQAFKYEFNKLWASLEPPN